MRKASSLGIVVIVTATIALIVLAVSLLLSSGALRTVNTATSECADGLGFCIEKCGSGNTLAGVCQEGEMCCSVVRAPKLKVEFFPMGEDE